MDKFLIELNEQQLNIVVKGLGELPFKEVFQVYNTINNQYISQKQQDKSNKEASSGS